MTYKLLLWPAITLSVVTIILSGVIPVIVFKSFNKESIVEKIRKIFNLSHDNLKKNIIGREA